MKTTGFYLLLLISTSVILSSCGDKYDITTYYNRNEQDSLLADIITYIYVRAPYSKWDTRFDPKFRKYYVSHLRDFKFDKYYRDGQGTHYYYIIRPARSAAGNIRGVGGKFTLNEKGKIVSFEEVFNTPVASLEDLQNRGRELFIRMIKSGNVNDYLRHPDYIEWPDELTYYDTLRHEWLIKPGI